MTSASNNDRIVTRLSPGTEKIEHLHTHVPTMEGVEVNLGVVEVSPSPASRRGDDEDFVTRNFRLNMNEKGEEGRNLNPSLACLTMAARLLDHDDDWNADSPNVPVDGVECSGSSRGGAATRNIEDRPAVARVSPTPVKRVRHRYRQTGDGTCLMDDGNASTIGTPPHAHGGSVERTTRSSYEWGATMSRLYDSLGAARVSPTLAKERTMGGEKASPMGAPPYEHGGMMSHPTSNSRWGGSDE